MTEGKIPINLPSFSEFLPAAMMVLPSKWNFSSSARPMPDVAPDVRGDE